MAVQTAEKVTKNNLRIISKPHAYLQTMTKTSVKFQMNRHKTVGGVANTRYIGGRKDGRNDGKQKTMSLCFLAHLSRRLTGELIVYTGIRRPSVRPSTFSYDISSEAVRRILSIFHI